MSLQDYYHWLPEEFWTALDEGKTYEFENECDPYGDYILIGDDYWSRALMHTQYETEDGKFYIVVYTDYSCGDSEEHKRYLVHTEEEAKEAEAKAAMEWEAARERTLTRYLEFVADTGTDPMGEFMIQRERKFKRKYHLQIENSVMLAEFTAWKTPRGEWRKPHYAPYIIHEFLMCGNEGIFPVEFLVGYHTEDGAYTWDKFLEVAQCEFVVKDDFTAVIEVELEMEVPVRNVGAKLKRAAEEALKECDDVTI